MIIWRNRSCRRWALLLVLGLLPVMATGSRQLLNAARALAALAGDFSARSLAWTRPDAGLEATVFDIEAGKLVRDAGAGSYAISSGIEQELALYVGTVTAAWPARPDPAARLRVRLAGEPDQGCTPQRSNARFSLDACR